MWCDSLQGVHQQIYHDLDDEIKPFKVPIASSNLIHAQSCGYHLALIYLKFVFFPNHPKNKAAMFLLAGSLWRQFCVGGKGGVAVLADMVRLRYVTAG